jgi:hypothetical protein
MQAINHGTASFEIQPAPVARQEEPVARAWLSAAARSSFCSFTQISCKPSRCR